jgi:hypothetical protein
MFGAFFNTVIQEVGMEKALALLSKCMEDMGSMMGKTMKEQMGIKELDAKTIISMMKELGEDFGFGSVIEESPTMVRFKSDQCACYEGSQRAGLGELSLEAMCRYGPMKFMGALVKQLSPNLSY